MEKFFLNLLEQTIKHYDDYILKKLYNGSVCKRNTHIQFYLRNELLAITYGGFDDDDEVQALRDFFHGRIYYANGIDFQVKINFVESIPVTLFGVIKILNQVNLTSKSHFDDVPLEITAEILKYVDGLSLTLFLRVFRFSEGLFAFLLGMIEMNSINFNKFLKIIGSEFSRRELYMLFNNYNSNLPSGYSDVFDGPILRNTLTMKFECYEKYPKVFEIINKGYPGTLVDNASEEVDNHLNYSDRIWYDLFQNFKQEDTADILCVCICKINCEMDIYSICDELYSIDKLNGLDPTFHLRQVGDGKSDINLIKAVKWMYNHDLFNSMDYLHTMIENEELLKFSFGYSTDDYKINKIIEDTQELYEPLSDRISDPYNSKDDVTKAKNILKLLKEYDPNYREI